MSGAWAQGPQVNHADRQDWLIVVNNNRSISLKILTNQPTAFA